MESWEQKFNKIMEGAKPKPDVLDKVLDDARDIAERLESLSSKLIEAAWRFRKLEDEQQAMELIQEVERKLDNIKHDMKTIHD